MNLELLLDLSDGHYQSLIVCATQVAWNSRNCTPSRKSQLDILLVNISRLPHACWWSLQFGNGQDWWNSSWTLAVGCLQNFQALDNSAGVWGQPLQISTSCKFATWWGQPWPKKGPCRALEDSPRKTPTYSRLQQGIRNSTQSRWLSPSWTSRMNSSGLPTTPCCLHGFCFSYCQTDASHTKLWWPQLAWWQCYMCWGFLALREISARTLQSQSLERSLESIVSCPTRGTFSWRGCTTWLSTCWLASGLWTATRHTAWASSWLPLVWSFASFWGQLGCCCTWCSEQPSAPRPRSNKTPAWPRRTPGEKQSQCSWCSYHFVSPCTTGERLPPWTNLLLRQITHKPMHALNAFLKAIWAQAKQFSSACNTTYTAKFMDALNSPWSICLHCLAHCVHEA